jgi:HlyD family secretion protein
VSALGIEEQRVWVIADIVSPPEQRSTVGDGFRVEASIVTWEGANVLKVSAGALFRQRNDWAVYVVRQARAELQTLRVGRTNGLETEVLEGLTVGDQIILHPSDRVRPGVRLRPR